MGNAFFLNIIFFQAKTILTDPKERALYDSWRSSGIAMK